MKNEHIILKTALAILLTSAACLAAACQAADLGRGYDWTIKVKTEVAEHLFSDKKSGLNPVEKVDIRYYKGAEEKSSEHYQKLWYHKGKPIGLERLHEFKLDQGESACIIVTHKKDKGTEGEAKAAANIILRLWLDNWLNKNQLTIAKVPADSMQAVTAELTKANRLVLIPQTGNVETPNNATMTLLLASEPEGQKVKLGYYK